MNHRSSMDIRSILNDDNEESESYSQSPQPRGEYVASPEMHERPRINKRKFEEPISLPRKRPRPREIPIWAQRAMNVRPLAKYLNGVQPASIPIPRKAAPESEVDGIMKEICHFIAKNVSHNRLGLQPTDGQFEIEAKIGRIKGEYELSIVRAQSAAFQEDAVSQNSRIEFESDVTLPVHKKINADLNSAVRNSHEPSVDSRDSSTPSPNRSRIQYERRREVDSVYTLTAGDISCLSTAVRALLNIRPGRDPTCRLRVTRDKDEKQILAKIIKHRIADLHIKSRTSDLEDFDYRISINFEANWEGDLQTVIVANGGDARDDSKDRRKNRVSYSHGSYQIDLTQVNLKENDAKSEKEQAERASHELEVELAVDDVMKVAGKIGLDGPYEELIRGFLADIRTLARKSGRIGQIS